MTSNLEHNKQEIQKTKIYFFKRIGGKYRLYEPILNKIMTTQHIKHKTQNIKHNIEASLKNTEKTCHRTKAVLRRCSVKKVFSEISQNSQENI